jgi:hypothetical protein
MTLSLLFLMPLEFEEAKRSSLGLFFQMKRQFFNIITISSKTNVILTFQTKDNSYHIYCLFLFHFNQNNYPFMASKTSFFCQNCGAHMPKWQGQCNSCKEWNTIAEE